MPADTLTRTEPPTSPDVVQARARTVAVASAAAIAVLYLAIYAGLLSVGRAEAGELGILGVAGGVFVVLAVALWRLTSRLLWAGAAVLQVLLGAMYVAIAPERDPSFELWGLLIRALSLVLLVALVTLSVRARRT
jgi:hypothetical protein